MPYYVSKTITADEFFASPTLEKKIDVFEERVRVWQLDVAVEIERQINVTQDQDEPMKHAGYALISILLSYFEMVGEVLTGAKGKSTNNFVAGFENVFPGALSEINIRKIYKRVRCGMYHVAHTTKGTVVSGVFSAAFLMDAKDNVCVNPHLMVHAVREHFDEFVSRLRDPNEAALHAYFESHFMGT